MIDINFNEIFTYDNGKLYWKKKISNKSVIGKEAGYFDLKSNRHFVTCNGKQFARSRVVYAMFNGFSEKKIDHINRIASDDRIENLRNVTIRENGINRGVVINNQRNLPACVYFDSTNKRNPYYVRARVNGTKKIIGWATTPELAESLYKSYFNISI
jgi:hypothetical protein